VYARAEGADARDITVAAVREVAPRLVLEAGCGFGELAERLTRELGVEVVAVDLSPEMVELARRRGIPTERAQGALEELRRRGLVTIPRPDSSTHSQLTANGCQVLQRLVSARRAHLEELAEEWDPEHGVEAASYLRNAVRDLVPDVRRIG